MQADLFPQPARTLPAPPTKTDWGPELTACPRCGNLPPEGFGWVVSFAGPMKGLRCVPCWEVES